MSDNIETITPSKVENLPKNQEYFLPVYRLGHVWCTGCFVTHKIDAIAFLQTCSCDDSKILTVYLPTVIKQDRKQTDKD